MASLLSALPDLRLCVMLDERGIVIKCVGRAYHPHRLVQRAQDQEADLQRHLARPSDKHNLRQHVRVAFRLNQLVAELKSWSCWSLVSHQSSSVLVRPSDLPLELQMKDHRSHRGHARRHSPVDWLKGALEKTLPRQALQGLQGLGCE